MYEWRLIFGARDIEYGSNRPVKPPMQERYVERIVIHDRYRPGMEVNDIALLKITPPVLCGRFVGPGCLPQFAAGPPSIPQKCWVIGWGYLRENGECGGASGSRAARLSWGLRGDGPCAGAWPSGRRALRCDAESPVGGLAWRWHGHTKEAWGSWDPSISGTGQLSPSRARSPGVRSGDGDVA